MSSDYTFEEMEQIRKSQEKLYPKSDEQGVTFILFVFSWWQGDIGFAIAEVETWSNIGSLFSLWWNSVAGLTVDIFYISYWQRLFKRWRR